MKTAVGFVKNSEEGKERPFERSFAQLAWTVIKDKAPRLLDHVIGFQLVRATDDNNRAVGVFVFRIGENLWLHVPLFYDRGRIRGEVLIVQNSNLKVPLSEKWVNYLIGREKPLLGEADPRSRSELGFSAPNLSALAASFLSKSGAEGLTVVAPPTLADWAAPAVGALEGLFKRSVDRQWSRFPKRIVQTWMAGNVGRVKAAFDLYESYPKFRWIIDRAYGGKRLFAEALDSLVRKSAAVDPPSLLDRPKTRMFRPDDLLGGAPPTSIRKSAVEIIRYDSLTVVDRSFDWPEEDRSRLISKGYVIRDGRPESEKTRIVPDPDPLDSQVSSPTRTGIYEVLDSSGEWVDCLVALGGWTHQGRKVDAAFVAPLDRRRMGVVVESDRILARRRKSDAEFEKTLDGLPRASETKKDFVAVYLGRDGECSIPFHVYDVVRKGSLFFGRFDCGYDGPYRLRLRPSFKEYGIRSDREVVQIVEPGGFPDRMTLGEGKLLVPGGCAVWLEDLGKDVKRFDPGSWEDWIRRSRSKAAALTAWSDGGGVVFKTAAWTRRLSPNEALFWLVKGAGLSEESAESILKTAQAGSGFSKTYWLEKPAAHNVADYPLARPFPDPIEGQSSMFGDEALLQIPFEVVEQVPELGASQTDPFPYSADANRPPVHQDAAQVAQLAAMEGDREVVDTAVLSSMLRSVRSDNLTSEDLPILIRAMDVLGGQRLKFLWNTEVFEKRYGAKDLPELEDTMLNAFQTLGDLILFEKEKTVDPLGMAATDMDLEDSGDV
jgi:hypothetical protein